MLKTIWISTMPIYQTLNGIPIFSAILPVNIVLERRTPKNCLKKHLITTKGIMKCFLYPFLL